MKTTRWVIIGAAVMQPALGAGVASGQEAGIRFEQSLTWQEIQAKARRENRFVFLAWPAPQCEPCVERSRELYAQSDIAQLFNAKFLSVTVPVDSASGSGNAYAASWAAARRELRERYQLPETPSVPILLFFSPEGQAVHRAVGWTDADGLRTAASDALNPQRQYYTLRAQYRGGKRDLTVMPHLARTARSLGDQELGAAVAKEYLDRSKENDLLTKDNVLFVAEFTERSSDRGFGVLRRHAGRINQVMDSAGYAERRIDAIITREEVTPRLKSVFREPTPDWEAIQSEVARRYGAADAERVIAEAKRERAKWLAAMEGPRLHVGRLNSLAWNVFLESTDPEELKTAADWMKRALDQEGESMPGYIIDTYANLLYKVGRVEEGIAWQEKAVAAAEKQGGFGLDGLRDTLAKMRKGEPTWPQRD